MKQNANGDVDSDDTTVYQLLPSDDGDNGLSVNRAAYDRYPEGEWFKIGLKVVKINRRRGEYAQDVGPAYYITYQSTRPDPDMAAGDSRDGGSMIERVTARAQDSLYEAGKVGLFTYATQLTVDNVRITPIGSTVGVAHSVGRR